MISTGTEHFIYNQSATYFDQEGLLTLNYIQDCDSPAVHQMMASEHYLLEEEH